MAMSQQEKKNLNDHLDQIYGWGGQTDQFMDRQRRINTDHAQWRDGVDVWGTQVNAWGSDVSSWIEEVDAYGEEAQRRFLMLGTRTNDLQQQYNVLRRQVNGLRRMTSAVPVWPALIGLIGGAVTGVIVGLNTDNNQWWSAGIALAVAAIVFGVLFFVESMFHTKDLPQNPPPPLQQHQQQTPTQVMPAVQQPAPPVIPNPPAAAAAQNQGGNP